VLAWPLVVLIIAIMLKDKIKKIEGLGLKTKLKVEEASEEISEIKSPNAEE
jgi:hypothetical protein